MKSIAQKWGNSLAVRIPKAFAEEVHIKEGVQVEMELHEGGVLIRLPAKKVLLKSLLARVTKKNRHGEVQWGTPQGDEIW